MREMIFRAYIKSQNKMIYKNFHDHDWYYHPTENKHAFAHRQNHHVLPLMQYTGLKDKNGKMIFEGDLMIDPNEANYDCNCACCECDCNSCSPEKKLYEVKFDRTKDGRYSYYLEHNDNQIVFHKYFSEFVIVGNIYENPELLKE